MTGWTVTADREVCIGSGQCVTYAPGTFAQDAEAKVVVAPGSDDDLATVRVAVEACPTNALSLASGGAHGHMGLSAPPERAPGSER